MDYMKEVTQFAHKAQDIYVELLSDIDGNEKNLQLALFFIIFNPTFWNIVARLEYNTKFITKIAGSPRRGCYLLAMTIFSLGIVRDYFFHQALGLQKTSDLLDNDTIKKVGMGLIAAGQILVITSMYQLGVTGTYLGDYFGILMDHIVTSFPFNVSNNPMYHGSTLSFLGTSLYYGKAAGVFSTLLVNLMYNVAQQFEEPFTAKIYAKRDAEKATKSQ
ncbi:LANO_0E16424g1_1 [Lachancea nothofagi CBS 11611]|uniref:Phosphatidyl-N-methylethanolamine N-methyltransferase n=1 Tax=Lachancea nothofagi CBS 11611 TaxID=1266666 RepID=A0A1G4K215_9SACH|nr:LANO_0E16424g1_1 [Lachancea nothofagi CBS 11611]